MSFVIVGVVCFALGWAFAKARRFVLTSQRRLHAITATMLRVVEERDKLRLLMRGEPYR